MGIAAGEGPTSSLKKNVILFFETNYPYLLYSIDLSLFLIGAIVSPAWIEIRLIQVISQRLGKKPYAVAHHFAQLLKSNLHIFPYKKEEH